MGHPAETLATPGSRCHYSPGYFGAAFENVLNAGTETPQISLHRQEVLLALQGHVLDLPRNNTGLPSSLIRMGAKSAVSSVLLVIPCGTDLPQCLTALYVAANREVKSSA